MLKISVGLDITKFSHANIDISVKVLAVDVTMDAVYDTYLLSPTPT